jgi:hypothetical protein
VTHNLNVRLSDRSWDDKRRMIVQESLLRLNQNLPPNLDVPAIRGRSTALAHRLCEALPRSADAGAGQPNGRRQHRGTRAVGAAPSVEAHDDGDLIVTDVPADSEMAAAELDMAEFEAAESEATAPELAGLEPVPDVEARLSRADD